ncbi:MAG: D-2-hydroxyacid dehydrogenase [Chloroflexi bacterium]|nr:D-2-hydroxyacid dehydrogenase [Chloroflexota bacterium]
MLQSLTDSLLAQVKAFEPQVRVEDGAALLVREIPEALRPGQQPSPVRTSRSLDELLTDAEVVLSARRLPKDIVRRAPRLRWVQFPLAGVEILRDSDLWSHPEVRLTSGAGTNATPVAEYVIAGILAIAKDVPRMVRSQSARRWERHNLGLVSGRTVGIVGLGSVGGEVARLAQGIGMRVLATRRRVVAGAPAWVLPQERLDELLRQSDYVVLAVPTTPETTRMIGRRELSLMKPGTVLINVARGEVVDETALIEALQSGRLDSAVLDVFECEPLPAESPLWTMPNVLVSAHIAGLFDDYDARIVDAFVENLERYLAGRPLEHEVDREQGY